MQAEGTAISSAMDDGMNDANDETVKAAAEKCLQKYFKAFKALADGDIESAREFDLATAKRDGYEVPLIGVPKSAQLEECDLCHDEFKMEDLELAGTQMLCGKCRKT